VALTQEPSGRKGACERMPCGERPDRGNLGRGNGKGASVAASSLAAEGGRTERGRRKKSFQGGEKLAHAPQKQKPLADPVLPPGEKGCTSEKKRTHLVVACQDKNPRRNPPTAKRKKKKKTRRGGLLPAVPRPRWKDRFEGGGKRSPEGRIRKIEGGGNPVTTPPWGGPRKPPAVRVGGQGSPPEGGGPLGRSRTAPCCQGHPGVPDPSFLAPTRIGKEQIGGGDRSALRG